MKNRYVGRTFIQPTQTMRRLGIRIKLNPLREAIGGRRLVVVDDSIVRGNTTKAIVGMLRKAGAREVHVRITSPPVRWPCFYGIDMATRTELVASDLLTHEVAGYLGADSLGSLSLEALVAATGGSAACGGPGDPSGALCTACLTGHYPIPVANQQATAVPERGATDRLAARAPSTCAGSAEPPRPARSAPGLPLPALSSPSRHAMRGASRPSTPAGRPTGPTPGCSPPRRWPLTGRPGRKRRSGRPRRWVAPI
jgi:amidophosphoribosyltransferase